MSAITQIQGMMITRALRFTSYGQQYLEAKERGEDLSKFLFMLTQKDDPMVPKEVRDSMNASGEGKFWTVVWGLKKQSRISRWLSIMSPLPKNASKQFSDLYHTACKNKPEAPYDFWCIITADGLSYLSGVSLSEYVKELALESAPAAENTTVETPIDTTQPA